MRAPRNSCPTYALRRRRPATCNLLWTVAGWFRTLTPLLPPTLWAYTIPPHADTAAARRYMPRAFYHTTHRTNAYSRIRRTPDVASHLTCGCRHAPLHAARRRCAYLLHRAHCRLHAPWRCTVGDTAAGMACFSTCTRTPHYAAPHYHPPPPCPILPHPAPPFTCDFAAFHATPAMLPYACHSPRLRLHYLYHRFMLPFPGVGPQTVNGFICLQRRTSLPVPAPHCAGCSRFFTQKTLTRAPGYSTVPRTPPALQALQPADAFQSLVRTAAYLL